MCYSWTLRSQFADMFRLALIAVALGLLACVSTAPEMSKSPLDDKTEKSEYALAGPTLNAMPKKGDIVKDVETNSKLIEEGEKDTGLVKSAVEDDEKDMADRGIVSDILDATISGIQLGIGLGSTNGTLDKLCIKIGSITMAGCRRTAASKDVEATKENSESSTIKEKV